jgi:hypothetical protein
VISRKEKGENPIRKSGRQELNLFLLSLFNLFIRVRRFRLQSLESFDEQKKTPGPKQSSITEIPVAIPQNVPMGAQQSSRRRTMTWLGTATSSSRMLPRSSQRVARLSSASGSSDFA